MKNSRKMYSRVRFVLPAPLHNNSIQSTICQPTCKCHEGRITLDDTTDFVPGTAGVAPFVSLHNSDYLEISVRELLTTIRQLSVSAFPPARGLNVNSVTSGIFWTWYSDTCNWLLILSTYNVIKAHLRQLSGINLKYHSYNLGNLTLTV